MGYQYEVTGAVKQVTGAGYAGVASYISNIEYRAFGAKKMVYGNGRQLDVLYNNRLQMTRWTVGGVLDDEYFYTNSGENNTGRVTFVQSNLDRTLDHSYAYDSVGRLTFAYTGAEARAHVGNGSWGNPDGPYALGYEYDSFGNMTRRYGWGGWNYAYTASYVNNRRVGDQYDAAGNLSSSGGQSFTYDATNQQAIAYTYSLSQYYDGDRLRVKKVESGATTYYLRSSVLGGQVICEINGSGEWTKGYVYLGSQLLAIQQQGTVQWVHQEPVTKAQRITNTAGQVISTIEFDPFGGETNRSSNSALQTHKYTSYERNIDGNDYAMARQYHGFWSRFDQPDPFDGSYDLTNPQSLNRYSYVQNDPVNFVDPSGLANEKGEEDCAHNPGGVCNVAGNDTPHHLWADWAWDWFFGSWGGGGGYGIIQPIGGGGGGGGGGGTGGDPGLGGDAPQSGLAPNGLGSNTRLSDADCDKKLASIFGGPGAVVGSTRDPLTVGSNPNALAYAQRYGRPTDRIGERGIGHGPAPYDNPDPNSSDRGGIIHIYGNDQGTASNTALYAPSGGTVGRIFTTGSGNVTRRVSYSTGLTISFVHVIPGGGPGRSGSSLLGTIGGPDSGGPNYRHTHIVFFSNFARGIRVDPRKVFCGQ